MTYDDRPSEKGRASRAPTITFWARLWRPVANFDRPHQRENAHGESLVSPIYDHYVEVNHWIEDHEWEYSEHQRFRREVWPGNTGDPKDVPINERGLEVGESDGIRMPGHVKDELVDLFEKLTKEDRLGRGKVKGRAALYRPEQTMDPRTRMLQYDEAYKVEDGRDVQAFPWDPETGWPIEGAP